MSTILDGVQEIDYNEEGELELARKKEEIDIKLVTFTLAGRHYAIDIMKVKEISKAFRFTYVPNTPGFVEGVYNLRGDIITIINMRSMFHLPEQKRGENELASILILNVQDTTIGVIVDVIENVLGVNSKNIQPRHPLFTDIQMKYISGVIDTGGKLYVILDVDRIFGEESEVGGEKAPQEEAQTADAKEEKPAEQAKKTAKKKEAEDIDFQFIAETLATFAGFHVDPGNEPWVRSRLAEWKKIRAVQRKGFQLENPRDAQDFLDPFYSPYTGSLWGEEYKNEFEGVLWKGDVPAVKAWNPGSGKGTEAYSICSILKLRYPQARIKVWACDSNLLAISGAPAVSFSRDTIPDFILKAKLVKEGPTGYQFTPEMKELVLFEYHDIVNGTALPELDLIVIRDLLSFFPAAQKERLVADVKDKLKVGGILVVGTHERLRVPGLVSLAEGNIVAYQKEKE